MLNYCVYAAAVFEKVAWYRIMRIGMAEHKGHEPGVNLNNRTKDKGWGGGGRSWRCFKARRDST